jgi:hypothetical protein
LGQNQTVEVLCAALGARLCVRLQIVPVEITVKLLKTAMEEKTRTGGRTNFLIDGFPRSVDNYEGWCRVMGAGGAGATSHGPLSH